MKLLADANWLIRLRGEIRQNQQGPAFRLLQEEPIYINTVAQAEFLSAGRDPEVLKILARCVRLKPLTYEDANDAGSLRFARQRAGKTLHLPDALMAATALRRHMRLLTADKDFSGIPGLKWSSYPH